MLGSERTKLGSERTHLGSERTYLGSECTKNMYVQNQGMYVQNQAFESKRLIILRIIYQSELFLSLCLQNIRGIILLCNFEST